MRPPGLRRPARGPRADERPGAAGGGTGLSVVHVHSAHLPGTAVGTLNLWATDRGLRRLDFRPGPDLAAPGEHLSDEAPPDFLAGTLQALRDYFTGHRRDFRDIPLDLGGVTDFQERVYGRLLEIPYGRVVTYGEVARHVAEGAGASRAVGQAVGANPVAIIIPCHRVVASDHSLHGYGGGLARKAALLRLEGVDVDGVLSQSRVHPDVLNLPL